MEKEALLALWDYDSWANERILTAAAGLSPEELHQPLASGHDTLLGTLWHVVGAAETWRVRAETGRDPVGSDDQEPPIWPRSPGELDFGVCYPSRVIEGV